MNLNFVNEVEFNYSPFQDDIFLTGKKNEGKTTKVKHIIQQTLKQIPYWIWDFNGKFGKYGDVVHSIEQLGYGQYVIQPRDKSKTNFRRFLDKLFYGAMDGRFTNTVIIVDELHTYLHKNEILQELYNICLTGRNHGLSGIYVSTSPKNIPNWMLDITTHYFCFNQTLEASVEWLERNLLGMEAWLLMTHDKRRKLFEIDNKTGRAIYPELPPSSHIYRDTRDSRSQIYVNGGVDKLSYPQVAIPKGDNEQDNRKAQA